MSDIYAPMLRMGTVWLSILLGACVLAAACQHLNFGRGEAPPKQVPTCLDSVSKLEAMELEVAPALEERLKNVISGALYLEQTVENLDDRLASVCESLSRELGAKNPEIKQQSTLGRRTELACKKSVDQLRSLKEKSGAGLSVEAKEFRCGVRPDDFGACAKKCDPHLPPGNLEITCGEGELWGRCAGKCTGQCGQVNTTECASTCVGECRGSCRKGFYGTCGGRCIGTCDMGNINGKCDGNCAGKCLSDARGSCEGVCKGKCTGNCVREVKAKACDGTCRGECDGSISAAVCGELLPPPEMTPACVSMCSAKLTAKLQCTSDHVGVTLYRADNEAEGKRIQGALSRRMRDVLEIGDGMKPHFEEAAMRIGGALDSLMTDIEDEAETEPKVARCLAEAKQRQESALTGFSRLSEASAAIFQATRD